MGLTGWIKQKLEGDPVERKFRKEAKAEAKKIETEAFHEAYKEALAVAAVEKARTKAKAMATKGGSGSGILNTLGNIGEKMNKASAGLVAGIEINPDGANQNFNVKDPFTPSYGESDRQYRRRRKRNAFDKFDDPLDPDNF